MMENNAKPSWMRAHGSMIFVIIVLMTSVALLVFGYFAKKWDDILAAVVLQMGSTGLAASTFAIFLSFRDVRDYFASVVASLLSQHNIAGLLSPGPRKRLRRALLLADTRAKNLEPSLCEAMETMTGRCLEMVHVHNFHCAEHVRADPEGSGLFLMTHKVSFRISARHLPGELGEFRFRRANEFRADALASTDSLRSFSAQIGDDHYDQVETKRTRIGDEDIVQFIFDKELEVHGEAELSMTIEFVREKNDPMEVFIARYPTRGFHVELTFDANIATGFDGIWFKSWDSVGVVRSDRGRTDARPNGIAAYAHDWVLPGEGVAIEVRQT